MSVSDVVSSVKTIGQSSSNWSIVDTGGTENKRRTARLNRMMVINRSVYSVFLKLEENFPVLSIRMFKSYGLDKTPDYAKRVVFRAFHN